jgi:recombination protein RecA
VSPPFKVAEFDIYYGQGVSQESSLLNLGVQLGIVGKSGAWLSYNNEKIGQGRDNARLYLIEHPEIAAEIKEEILKQFNLGNAELPQEIE